MPLGIARLNTLARYIADAPAAVGGNLDAVSLAANNYLYMSNEINSGESSNTTATWSVWFKLANSSPRSVPFGMYNSAFSGTADRLFGVFLFNNSVDATARFYHQTLNGTIDRTSSETSLYNTGDWHHICAAYDTNGGTTPQVYVDGVQATMPSIASGVAAFPWTYIDLWINGYSDGAQQNDIEVAQLWVDNSYYDLSTNLEKFYDTTNNQAVDLGSDGTATGLSQPLIYHNGDASSFGTNSGTLSYTLQVQGSVSSSTGPAFGGSSGIVYRTDTYANNVYLALPFDSSNELNDVSPSINSSSTQATLSSGANSSVTSAEVYWTSTPDYNKALENVNTGSTTSMAYSLSTSIPTSASGTFVIEGWFLADDATTNGNWAISSADSGGRFLFGVNNGSTYTFGNENRVGIGSGWHHLAIVCDSGTKRFYTDGVYKGAWVSPNTGFSTLHIGQFNAGDNSDFQGHIQDFRVTIGSNRGYTGTNTGSANFTLPQSIVESGIPAVALSRPYTISRFGNAEVDTAQVKYGTGSLLPNGGRLEVEMDMPSGDFTIEGWYRINNRSAPSGCWEIRDDSNSTHRLALYGGEAGGGFKVLYLTYVDASGTEQIDIVTPTGTFPDDSWKHCAVTKNGNTFTVWIDGVNRGSATYSSFTMPTTTTFNLGGAATDNRYFRGNVDEFRMSDTARYTTGFTAPTGEHSNDSNTLLLVHMNGADGSTSFTDDNT